MPERESCGSVLRCRLPPFDPLLGSRACRHACRFELPSRLPSREAGTCNLHSDCCRTVPDFPRLRALALFGRRTPQRVDRPSLPASKNLHRLGRGDHSSVRVRVAGAPQRTHFSPVGSGQAWADAVEKRFWGIFLSNIDSK